MTALIGALRVSMSADTANFEAGMKRAQRQTTVSASAIQKSMGMIKASLAGLAAGFSVGLLTNAIRSSLEYAGSLGEVSQQLGVTTRDLQLFRAMGAELNITQEEMDKGLAKLTLGLSKAEAGSKETQKAFAAVGVSMDDIKNRTGTVEILGKMSDGMKRTGGASANAAAGVAIMGKNVQKFTPLLDMGSAGINNMADSIERTGQVLSDEQIQKADATADKLQRLQGVLKTSIAGAVADNADAIMDLGNALAFLVRSIGDSIKGWRIMTAEFNGFLKAGALLRHGILSNPFTAADAAGQSARKQMMTDSTWSNIIAGTAHYGKHRPVGGDIGKFLAPDGKKAKADHSAEDALREQFQFDQDIRRANIDILNAKKDLAKDYIEQTTISIQILDAEKAAYDAELEYEVALNKLTKGKQGLSEAQAAQKKVLNDQKDSLERQLLLQQEQEQRQQDVNMLEQHDFDRRKDYLQSQDAIATTAAERRRIELELLDLAYQQKKQALEYTIATSKDIAAVEDARRDLLNLNKTYANDRQGVMQNTQGPLEQYFSQVPKNADEANEAMQRLEVQGIDGAINSIIALTDGFQSFRDTAISAIKQVIAELLRMQLMKLAFSLFGGAAGGIGGGVGGASTGFVGLDGLGSMPGFATGGSMILGGMGGRDRNVLSLNGLPIARVSKGEGLHISPNGMPSGGTVVNINVSGNPTRETLNQIAVRTRGAIASANRGGY